MENDIFIPQKIRVGYQKRNDTYTKKLAYVIYYDTKNVLRKEASWNGWRDKKIDPQDFENIPMSGFVLNKKVGGYRSDWNYRSAHVRVYDPRGFEFEIGLENLLYILENTNSIKGKGLEGDFVYGYSGKDLVLMPTSSPDYIQLMELNSLRFKKDFIKSKDLIIGATYRHVNNRNYIYMGRFDYYKSVSSSYHKKDYDHKYEISKRFYFYPTSKPEGYSYDAEAFKSISSKFIGVVDEKCVVHYSTLYEKMTTRNYFSPIDPEKIEFVPYTRKEVEQFVDQSYCYGFYAENSDFSHRIEKNRKYHLGQYDEYKYQLVEYNDRRVSDYYCKSEFIEFLLKYKIGYIKLYLKNGKFYEKRGN